MIPYHHQEQVHYRIAKGHPCFPEAFQFAAHYVGRAGLTKRVFAGDHIAIESKPWDSRVLMLYGVNSLLQYLKNRPGAAEPAYVQFVTFEPDAQSRRRPSIKLPGDRLGPSICTTLLGSPYERYQEHFLPLLPPPSGKRDYSTWPADWQFFRHVRNAAFHNGTFKVWPPEFSPTNPPAWNGVVMKSRADVNKKRLINDGILAVTQVLPLLHDLGNRIKAHYPKAGEEWR